MKRPEPLIRLSASKIQAANCPHYFYNQYIKENADTEAVDGNTPMMLTVGRFCHKVIEEYNKSLIAHRVASDRDLFIEKFDMVWSGYAIPESMYDELKTDMLDFAEYHVIDLDTVWKEGEIPAAINWDLQEVDFKSDEAWIRAKFDFINVYDYLRTAVITDYKTARYVPSEAELRKTRQAAIYPFLMAQLNPQLETITMIWHYIRRKNKKVMVTFTRPDLLETEESLRNFSSRLSKKVRTHQGPEEWAPIVGDMCAICRYECPLVSVDFRPIQNEFIAEDVAMQIQALLRKKKQLENALKGYVKTSESVVKIGTGYYDFSQQEILQDVKPQAVIDVCAEFGVSPDLLLSFDGGKFKKLEGTTGLEEKIKSLGKMSMRNYFRFVKNQKEDEDEE